MGAGIAQQLAVGVPRKKQRSHLPGVLDPCFIRFEGGRRDLKRRGMMQHIPVVDLQNVGGVGFGRNGQAGQVFGTPCAAKGFFLRFWQFFQGGFPAQSRGSVGTGFKIGKLSDSQCPGVFGSFAGLVGVEPGGRVVGPAGVELAAGAAHHIDKRRCFRSDGFFFRHGHSLPLFFST